MYDSFDFSGETHDAAEVGTDSTEAQQEAIEGAQKHPPTPPRVRNSQLQNTIWLSYATLLLSLGVAKIYGFVWSYCNMASPNIKAIYMRDRLFWLV